VSHPPQLAGGGGPQHFGGAPPPQQFAGGRQGGGGGYQGRGGGLPPSRGLEEGEEEALVHPVSAWRLPLDGGPSLQLEPGVEREWL